MPDLAGPIQALDLAPWLWLIPFFALGGVLLQLLGAVRGRLSAPVGSRVAVWSMALCLITAAIHALALARREAGERFLLDHVWQLVRVGQLDVGLDLALDPLSAGAVLGMTVLGLVFFWRNRGKSSAELGEEPRVFFARSSALVFAVLVLVLADNLVLLFVGWAFVTALDAAPVSAATPMSRAPSLVRSAGNACMIVGVAVLFWGLAGSWRPEGGYQSDLDPRIVAATVGPASPKQDEATLRAGGATKGKGYLTATALPGALVYVDESHTPLLDEAGLPLVTPFRRRELPPGAHGFRVAPDDRVRDVRRDQATFIVEGGVQPNYTVPRTAFGADREVALLLVGPTLKLRELHDQLVVSDPGGEHLLRDHVLAKKLWGGLGVVSVASLLFFLSLVAGVVSGPLARRAEAASPAALRLFQGGRLIAALYVLARLSFLLPLGAGIR